MEEVVSAAEAHRTRITPASRAEVMGKAARQTLLARLRAQPVQVIGGRWSRDELYED